MRSKPFIWQMPEPLPYRTAGWCLYHLRSAARNSARPRIEVAAGMAMTGKDELKRAVCDAIDRHGDEIIELGETILHHPETGFNEVKTAALIAERMRALGLEPQIGLAVTGVKGRLKGKMPGPRLAFIGGARPPPPPAAPPSHPP